MVSEWKNCFLFNVVSLFFNIFTIYWYTFRKCNPFLFHPRRKLWFVFYPFGHSYFEFSIRWKNGNLSGKYSSSLSIVGTARSQNFDCQTLSVRRVWNKYEFKVLLFSLFCDFSVPLCYKRKALLLGLIL